MKKLYIFIALFVAFGGTAQAKAASTQDIPHVVIAAIQTGKSGAPGDDFVVLHNDENESIDVTGWKVQYRSASATGTAGWMTKSAFTCSNDTQDCRVTIAAHGNMIAATYTLPDLPTQKLTSGFSDTGGQIRLVQSGQGGVDDTVIDTVGYGLATEFEGDGPAIAPAPGKVASRQAKEDRSLIDTDDNAKDFIIGCLTPTLFGSPVAVSCGPEPDDETQQPVPESDPDSTSPTTYASLLITELLPDPASPAVDSNDEFIEIYNPHDYSVNIAGYSLQAGQDFKDSFTFGEVVIPPNGYIAVFSSESRISLTNSGTSVRLLDPKQTVHDSVTYEQAKPGQVWAKNASGWQWSTQQTPGKQNVITAESPKTLAAAVLAAKKPAVAATKKAAAAKAPKAAAASKTTAAKSTKPPAAAAQPSESSPEGLHYALLGLAGAGILGYAGYEYRQEIGCFTSNVWRTLTRRKDTAQAEATPQTD